MSIKGYLARGCQETLGSWRFRLISWYFSYFYIWKKHTYWHLLSPACLIILCWTVLIGILFYIYQFVHLLQIVVSAPILQVRSCLFYFVRWEKSENGVIEVLIGKLSWHSARNIGSVFQFMIAYTLHEIDWLVLSLMNWLIIIFVWNICRSSA